MRYIQLKKIKYKIGWIGNCSQSNGLFSWLKIQPTCWKNQKLQWIFTLTELLFSIMATSTYPFHFNFVLHFPILIWFYGEKKHSNNGLSDSLYCSNWYALPVKYQNASNPHASNQWMSKWSSIGMWTFRFYQSYALQKGDNFQKASIFKFLGVLN